MTGFESVQILNANIEALSLYFPTVEEINTYCADEPKKYSAFLTYFSRPKAGIPMNAEYQASIARCKELLAMCI